MVPGRAAAALADRRALAHRRRARSGTTARCSPSPRRPAATEPGRTPRRSPRRWSPALGLRRRRAALAAVRGRRTGERRGTEARRRRRRATPNAAGAGRALDADARPASAGSLPAAPRPGETAWGTGDVAPAPRPAVPASPATRPWGCGCRSTRLGASTGRPSRRATPTERRTADRRAGPSTAARACEERDGHVLRVPAAARRARSDAARARRPSSSAAAAELRLPVVVEGYAPAAATRTGALRRHPRPRRHRGQHPPERSRGPSSSSARPTLFDEARADRPRRPRSSRSTACTRGTGGGNHLTLGGRTPADSPFLRRPDLLRSLVTFWQHHPSLSYLFSGRFIGPDEPGAARRRGPRTRASTSSRSRSPSSTGSRPRARRACLAGRPRCCATCSSTSPATRTGPSSASTSSSAPSSERGRLGRRRAARRSRCRRTRGWRSCRRCSCAPSSRASGASPYRGPPRALGHRAARPLPAALVRRGGHRRRRRATCAAHGFAFDAGVAGRRSSSSASRARRRRTSTASRIELRQAIEPWHVLGEEVAAGGDRPLRRLVGRAPAGPASTASRRRATSSPATAASCRSSRRRRRATFVAGVRFRAWQPPSALHPTIGVHSPLVFDLVDRWSGQIARRVHVPRRPSRRPRATRPLPVNAGEAEARRASRFEAHGHTPGQVEIPQPQGPGEHPRTLDLRRA